ncbi:MAG: hypothetical protein WB816_09965 [Methylocystis sp.]
MPRLVISCGPSFSSTRTPPKVGPTGRTIRDIEALTRSDESRDVLIRPRVLKRLGLLMLVGGTALTLAWWNLFNFAH